MSEWVHVIWVSRNLLPTKPKVSLCRFKGLGLTICTFSHGNVSSGLGCTISSQVFSLEDSMTNLCFVSLLPCTPSQSLLAFILLWHQCGNGWDMWMTSSRQMGRQRKCKYTFYTNSVYRWKIPLNMLQRVGLPEWGLWIPAIKLVTGNWCYLCDCISSLMENMVLLCIFSFGEYLTVPSYPWLGISPRVLLPGEVCLG